MPNKAKPTLNYRASKDYTPFRKPIKLPREGNTADDAKQSSRRNYILSLEIEIAAGDSSFIALTSILPGAPQDGAEVCWKASQNLVVPIKIRL